MAVRPSVPHPSVVPVADLLRPYAPALLGAALALAAAGLVLGPTSDSSTTFDAISDTIPESLEPTAPTGPPVDLATLLVDLAPRGFELLDPATTGTGPIESADEFVALAGGGVPAGISAQLSLRGHSALWRSADGATVVVLLVVELASERESTDFLTGMLDDFADEGLAPVDLGGLADAGASAGEVSDAGGTFQAFFGGARRGTRVYSVTVAQQPGVLDVGAAAAILHDQAAAG